jgi:nicotinamide mononucleotide (NMN) deamidase PncC
MVMEPAPLVTLMIRGVLEDLESKGAKAVTVMAGPTVLVANVVMSC